MKLKNCAYINLELVDKLKNKDTEIEKIEKKYSTSKRENILLNSRNMTMALEKTDYIKAISDLKSACATLSRDKPNSNILSNSLVHDL